MSPNPQHAIDKQIAAIALIYDLVVVTRNASDFEGTGVRVLNPFVRRPPSTIQRSGDWRVKNISG